MPVINLTPAVFDSGPQEFSSGQLTSESSAAATIRMLLYEDLGDEKLLVRTQKTFPSSSWRFENLAGPDNLSNELLNSSPSNQFTGALVPLSGGLVGSIFETGDVYAGVIDPSGTDPVLDTANASQITPAASTFLGKYQAISNGSDKVFVTYDESSGASETIKYMILNWNGSAFSVDESGTFQTNASSTCRTMAMVTTNEGASRGLIAYATSSAASQISSFTFNGTLANRNDTVIGEVPAGLYCEQNRLTLIDSSTVGFFMRNAAPSDIKVFKVTNLTGAPSLSTAATVTTGTFTHGQCLIEASTSRCLAWYRKDAFNIAYKIVDYSGATPTVGSEVVPITLGGGDFTTTDIDAIQLNDGRVMIGYVADIGAAPNEAIYHVLDSL